MKNLTIAQQELQPISKILIETFKFREKPSLYNFIAFFDVDINKQSYQVIFHKLVGGWTIEEKILWKISFISHQALEEDADKFYVCEFDKILDTVIMALRDF